ncbi:MAG TPA: hypothetical protein VGV92_09165 [Gammaproteobacteria bacterium]|nr:hypothetical protein [Gammaproteobacteria bacterium]
MEEDEALRFEDDLKKAAIKAQLRFFKRVHAEFGGLIEKGFEELDAAEEEERQAQRKKQKQ